MNASPMLPVGADRRADLIAHFAALSRADLRLRFGHALSIAALEAYVDDIDFEKDGIFGVFDADLRLVGVAHVALLRAAAEFGVSVLPGSRGAGVGKALFARAVTFARNHQVRSLFVHCLAENEVMLRIARAAGMRVVHSSGEAEAWLALAPGNASTLAEACVQDQIALFDYTLKSHFLAARTMAGAMGEASTALADVRR